MRRPFGQTHMTFSRCRWMFYAALTAEEKPGHHYFFKLHIPLSKHELQVLEPVILVLVYITQT